MLRSFRLIATAGVLGIAAPLASPVLAQGAPVTPAPKIGERAPDFTIPVSTKDGVGAKPLHLADLKGQTVVLRPDHHAPHRLHAARLEGTHRGQRHRVRRLADREQPERPRGVEVHRRDRLGHGHAGIRAPHGGAVNLRQQFGRSCSHVGDGENTMGAP